MEESVKILFNEFVTHDVKSFIVKKPKGYKYIPGQAANVAINREGWRDKKREFTFTSLNEDEVLQFIIKTYPVDKYPKHRGVTEELHKLGPGDELIIGEPFGTITYKGPGTFIAGGAGITPFVAILRNLKNKGEIGGNSLFFSNKTQKDIILQKEFEDMFKDNPGDLVFTLTQEKAEGCEDQLIDKDFLKGYIDDFSQNFYLCGPPAMVTDIKAALEDLGASTSEVVFEE